MKRFLIGLSIISIVIVTVFLVFFRSSSGFRSVYLVPEDAVLLVESRDPILAWDKIVHSNAWKHLKTNKKLQEISLEIESIDSIVSSNRLLMKLLGKRPVMLSQHPANNGEYEMLYIIDIGKIGKYKKVEKLIASALGNEYEITTRSYNEFKIIEILDTERNDNYFLSMINGKLIFSFDPKLVESSIEASEKMIVGRETKFLDVYSRCSSSGLLSVFINHNNLEPLIESLSISAKHDLIRRKNFLFSGVSFNINEDGLISIEGYTSLTNSSVSIYKGLFREGALDLASSEVIPQRLASLVKINFRNANDYFHSSIKSVSENEYESYLENLQKIEKKFKISLEENFFSWMDKEIVFLQTQPSNLGRSNEFAAILHASDSAKAAKNLKFLWKQIKKNSPVKIKSVQYKAYNIDYVAFPGFIKLLFGKALSKIEKPYFTQIGDNVIISNHPQTIKNLIDDYLTSSTLNSSIDYYNFNKLFGNRTAMFSYFEPPVLYHNLKGFLSTTSWQAFQKEKDYFTCFSQAGIQLELDDDILHYSFKALYEPEAEESKKQYYNSYEITSLFNIAPEITKPANKADEKENIDTIPKIVIHELDADKQEDYHEDGSIKWTIELKKGLKHGNFKEYYSDGKLKIKGSFDQGEPSGKWKYYNEDGDLIKTDRY